MYACGISDPLYNMEISSSVELVLHTDIKGDPKVTAAVGKKVVMTCEYAKKYKDSKKYWCKTNPKRCFYQSHYYQQIVHDDKWNYLFTLQIPWVEVTDAGSYECLIQNSRNAFLFFKVELAVIDYPIFTEPKNVTEYRGKSIKIKCHYSQTYNSAAKIWCKEERGGCTPLASSQYPQARVAFEDDRESGTLIVTMYDLTVNDTGCYKCTTSWPNKQIYCPVKLQVLDLEILKVQNTVEKTVGSPVMMECYYKPQYVEYEKYWCKLEMNGKCQSVNSNRDEQKRWEINDKTNNYTLTLYTRTLTMEDAGQYQCGIRRSEYPIDTVQVQLRVLPAKVEDTTINQQHEDFNQTTNSGTRIIAWFNENKIFLIIIGVLLVLILIIVVLLIAKMIRRRVRLTHNDKDNSFGVRLRNVQNTPAVYPTVQSSQQMASIGTSVDIEESSSDSSECPEDTPVVRNKERCNDDYVNVDKELCKEDDDYVNMVSSDGGRPESKGSPKLTCDYVNVEPLDSSESEEEEEEEKKEEVDKEPESSDLNPSRRLYKLQKRQQSDSSDSEGDTVQYTQIVFQ
uniref:Ig-like domain-containing protein n=1 Tax=Erpetoichthys calabaricus TaxID=27687 RepID=A0A8C4RTZ7_ERPCA